MSNDVMLEQDRANRERLSTRDFDKNFLVSAGAGAGKTYLTVQRAFNMLCDKELGVSPQDIVLITFTRKAATEMKTRLNRWIRDALANAESPEQTELLQTLLNSLPEMQISTIHSFCQRVLNDYPLESGVGFAPHFDPEDNGPDSRGTVYFNEAWMSGNCPETMSAGISQKVALAAFKKLSSRLTVQPQYIDLEKEECQEFAEETIQMSRNLVERFRSAAEGADPSLFKQSIENVLRGGENPPLGAVLSAARLIASQGGKVRGWMGKNVSKTAQGACADLGQYLPKNNPDSDDALFAIEKMFEAARSVKAKDRHSYISELVPGLPAGYRAAARVADMLPESEDLKKLAGDIDSLLHGIITKEALSLCKEYTEYRRKNHIISLDDMLNLTADLVRNHADVRQKLHSRYRTFFVDEYQDTDPIQTDILFGITAEKYDPDWHKCVPRPGSLFLVGDAKQGIYRFRGADISLWQEAEEAMKATGGEIVYLYKNFRSTTEICDAVTDIFSESGSLSMKKGPYQAEYNGMVAHRGHGPEAIFHHTITCDKEDDGQIIAAGQIAQFIQNRVESGQNKYEDFLLLSFHKEREIAYADQLRIRHIPVKFDGALPIDAYPPIQLLNMRVQAVCHPFDETLSFRVLCVCGNVKAEEWDLFRMNVKQLPEETKLTHYRDTRSLMGHVDELAELLPDTEMNRRVLKALAMLDRDRRLSQQRTPCAFLEELIERSEGLFLKTIDAEEFQNQYAALLQTIDSIRTMNPQQFADMADMLKTSAESEMDRMPSIRADSNFVRLMNLHKAKGLQGKIVIFLPKSISAPKADSSIQRDGMNTFGWFQITDDDSYSAPRYSPPDWDEHMKEEVEFRKAERIRLEYVALTRAEDEAHIFKIRTEQKSKGPAKADAWKGFDAVGTDAPAIAVTIVEDEAGDETPELAREARAAQQSLRDRFSDVNAVAIKRLMPSDADKKRLQNEPIIVEEQTVESAAEKKPGGTKWGSFVHRIAELVVIRNTFTDEGIGKAARQACIEQFPSELISERDRNALLIPKEAVTLEQIHEYLTGRAIESLAFMTDQNSSFRQMLKDAACYPELPFVISITKENDKLFDRLMPLADLKDENTIVISGKIDLALRYSDGQWRVLDYKTDRMLPGDHGDIMSFYSRLEQEYGTQLEIYKIVLEYLTGEPVVEAKLLTV